MDQVDPHLALQQLQQLTLKLQATLVLQNLHSLLAEVPLVLVSQVVSYSTLFYHCSDGIIDKLPKVRITIS